MSTSRCALIKIYMHAHLCGRCACNIMCDDMPRRKGLNTHCYLPTAPPSHAQ